MGHSKNCACKTCGHKGKLNIGKYENLIKDAYEGGSKGHNPLDPNDPKAQDSFGLVDHIKEQSKKVK